MVPKAEDQGRPQRKLLEALRSISLRRRHLEMVLRRSVEAGNDQLPHPASGKRRPCSRSAFSVRPKIMNATAANTAKSAIRACLRQVRRRSNPFRGPPRTPRPHHLAAPVTHIWFFKSIPSPFRLLLTSVFQNWSASSIMSDYIVTEVDEDEPQGSLEDLNASLKGKLKTVGNKTKK
jgi:hypothetical protein